MTTTPKILIIDDEEDCRSSIEMTIKDLGYDLFFAKDGAEGLRCYREISPLVTLLDLRMPIMNGVDVLKEMRLTCDDLSAVIVLSGHADEMEIKTCYELGVHSFLRKPFNIYELSGVIQQSIALKQVQRQLSDQMLDLTENYKELALQASHDPLTGLYNRHILLDHVQHAITLAERHDHCFGLFYFDIDDFKKVNDTHGHPAGDELLQQISKRIKNIIRDSDILARMGGDEFVLLVEEVEDSSDLTTLANRIMSTFSSEFYLGSQSFKMTGSIGIAVFPDGSSTPEEIIQHADTAMYKAKDAGRNCYKFYSVQMNEMASSQLELENDIRNALKNNEFTLYYQPKINDQSGSVCGAEALIRWQHPVKGIISPADFIPIAEKSDLIIDIGKWVREQVCRQLVEWKENNFPLFTISVNVSAKEFMKREVLQHLIELFLEYDIEQHLLELEITENTLMESETQGNTDYEIIRNMDVGLSIDDFGTGYCSLGYLKNFPINTLKIDKSFVDNVTTSERDAYITKAIIAMAHSLNMSVVAEGVETKEQHAFLRDNNCDQIQGYLYSRPQPVENFETFVLSFDAAGTSAEESLLTNT